MQEKQHDIGRRLKILLTNDDGYEARGIRCLYSALSERHDVVMVAPNCQQSGISHAFTYNAHVECKRSMLEDGTTGYIVGGTPSDCVKLGLAKLMQTMPDIVLSGINAGENTGAAQEKTDVTDYRDVDPQVDNDYNKTEENEKYGSPTHFLYSEIFCGFSNINSFFFLRACILVTFFKMK